MSLRVVALTVGELGAPELWTLRAIASAGFELTVVRAHSSAQTSQAARIRSLIRRHGFLPAVSRMAASRFIAPREALRTRREWDYLFDVEDLRNWWQSGPVPVAELGCLTSPDSVQSIAGLLPDVI